ncbi:DNA (cytosine-5-)-methyltransferase [Roseospira navarrensis]|uniref:DNA (cytosine-5-)-methyltransferase n=2 Tax=Roseospira navarrensis TaxID=140058 RepID=A0A7X1ZHC0_9PROT|nr:DNA (cytosine-5-)-methyltransferase [Roseospira navarrensis]
MQVRTFYEFFAGGGMVHAALKARGWQCVFANDICAKKAAAYAANWGANHLRVDDIRSVRASELPGVADLSWGSFPCQDLSLAGGYVGLSGKQSGTFWPFWHLQKKLMAESRGPRTIVLENVCGALTSHGGKDFAAIASAFSAAGYHFGTVIADAVHWLPQSRPRLFVIGVRGDVPIPEKLRGAPDDVWHPETMLEAYGAIPNTAKRQWIWWRMPKPAARNVAFIDLIEDEPTGTAWHSKEDTDYIVSLMSPLHSNRLKDAVEYTKKTAGRMVGGIYRRTRQGKQRAEVRFDGISGCLRTPVGGSSRQTVILVDKGEVRTRLLSPREAARLMGLSEDYKLPLRYNDAYYICGDGVAVPVVQWIAEHVVEPVLDAADAQKEATKIAAE